MVRRALGIALAGAVATGCSYFVSTDNLSHSGEGSDATVIGDAAGQDAPSFDGGAASDSGAAPESGALDATDSPDVDTSDATSDSDAAVEPLAYVQSATPNVDYNNAKATWQVNFPNPVGAGHLIVVAAGWDASHSITSMTDNRGNAYKRAVFVSNAAVYYAENAQPGATTITVSLAGSAVAGFYAEEFSGVATVASLDLAQGQTGIGTAADSTSLNTSAAHELLYGFATAETQASAPGPGFDAIDTFGGNMAEERIVTSVGLYSAAFTISPAGQWTALIATFKAAH